MKILYSYKDCLGYTISLAECVEEGPYQRRMFLIEESKYPEGCSGYFDPKYTEFPTNSTLEALIRNLLASREEDK